MHGIAQPGVLTMPCLRRSHTQSACLCLTLVYSVDLIFNRKRCVLDVESDSV